MFRLKVTPDEGDPYELTATTRDIAKWERINRGASLAGLQSNMHASDLYEIAFHSATRQGLYEGTMVAFRDGADLDVLDDEDGEPDPTKTAA